jgi:DNA polymerase
MRDLEALWLQIEWGADEALEAAPIDRLRAVDPPPPAPQEREDGLHVASLAAPATAASRAVRSAAAATTLGGLRRAIADFDGCALRDTAGSLVFAEGDPTAGLLLIGGPPSAPDDRSGTAFAGPPGEYLDRMLGSIGLARNQLLLTALIPWRPPGDRPPSPAELAACLPFLYRLIAIAAPRRLVLFGSLASRSLLPLPAKRRRPRREWIEVAIPSTPLIIPALPTFSPAELMRSPKDRRAAWADLRLLRRTLDADASSPAGRHESGSDQ